MVHSYLVQCRDKCNRFSLVAVTMARQAPTKKSACRRDGKRASALKRLCTAPPMSTRKNAAFLIFKKDKEIRERRERAYGVANSFQHLLYERLLRLGDDRKLCTPARLRSASAAIARLHPAAEYTGSTRRRSTSSRLAKPYRQAAIF